MDSFCELHFTGTSSPLCLRLVSEVGHQQADSSLSLLHPAAFLPSIIHSLDPALMASVLCSGLGRSHPAGRISDPRVGLPSFLTEHTALQTALQLAAAAWSLPGARGTSTSALGPPTVSFFQLLPPPHPLSPRVPPGRPPEEQRSLRIPALARLHPARMPTETRCLPRLITGPICNLSPMHQK